jgi:hypothetical protein
MFSDQLIIERSGITLIKREYIQHTNIIDNYKRNGETNQLMDWFEQQTIELKILNYTDIDNHKILLNCKDFIISNITEPFKVKFVKLNVHLKDTCIKNTQIVYGNAVLNPINGI